MPTVMSKQLARVRKEEISHIGPEASKRLHDGMNESQSSLAKRARKNANLSTGRRDGRPGEPRQSPVVGTKRHAAPGASPSEPTPAKVKRESKRATAFGEVDPIPRWKKAHSPTRRNDPKTEFNPRPMHGSKTKAKRPT
jgi:hypothetical protein